MAASFLGNTIEEKTRSILGWSEGYTPTCAPVAPVVASISQLMSTPAPPPPVNNRPAPRKDKAKKSKATARSANAAGTSAYPYSLLSAGGKGRKPSTGGFEASLRQNLTPPPSPASDSSRTILAIPAWTKLAPAEQRLSVDSSYGSLPVSPVSPNTPNPYTQQPLPTSASLPLPKSGGSGGKQSSQVFDTLRKLVPHMPADKNAYQRLVQTVNNVIELEHELQEIMEKKDRVRSMLAQQHGTQPTSFDGSVRPGSVFAVHSHSSNPLLSSVPSLNASASEPALCQSGSVHWDSSGVVPEDLLHVDVSAFKFLVSSPSHSNLSSSASDGGSSGSSWTSGCDLDLDMFVAGGGGGLDPLATVLPPATPSFCT